MDATHEFQPLPSGHWAIGELCGICRDTLKPGDVTVAVPRRQPTDEERANAGEYLTIECVLCHSGCVTIASAVYSAHKPGPLHN